MKAVRYRSYGDSGVLVYEDADRPVAGARQVVVKVAGAAFNPVDVAIRAGFMQPVFPLAFPQVTRLVTGLSPRDPAFQKRRIEFLRRFAQCLAPARAASPPAGRAGHGGRR